MSGHSMVDEGALPPSLGVSGRLRVGGDGWRRRGGLFWAVERRRAVEWLDSARRHGGILGGGSNKKTRIAGNTSIYG